MKQDHQFWHDKPFSEDDAKKKLDNSSLSKCVSDQILEEWRQEHIDRNTPLSKRLYDIRNKAINDYSVAESHQFNQTLQFAIDQVLADTIIMLDGSVPYKQFQISEYEIEMDSKELSIKEHTRPITENLLKNYFELVNGLWD
ncbi:hypothetical protein [Pseudomonas aeruginosa]|uniref:hypothetical protein n=1 Tax=Pseudomonas aeruginosa TaxID=287 RepID=UPI001CA54A96|nr:hypothetical protein [Pseudomonas aeruginosa]MBW6070124.1 hypothetical protein [Pseudomonas aeruginosa]